MVYVRSQQGLQQYLAPEVITTFSCFYTGDGHFSQKRCEKKIFGLSRRKCWERGYVSSVVSMYI